MYCTNFHIILFFGGRGFSSTSRFTRYIIVFLDKDSNVLN